MHDVVAFRADYRARRIGPRYFGWLHFAFVSVTCLVAIVVCVSRVSNLAATELLAVPVTFLFANAVEYFGHKGPMHHPRPLLQGVHRRHTLEHHHFFTQDAMACESPRDFQIMLFPPVLLLFFLGGIATPVGLLLHGLFPGNVAWLFTATAVGYYLCYEWLHFSYHLPPQSRVGRLWVVRVLRRHHQAHHELARMGTCNFNITFPIFDAILGTTARSR